jgi:hypothetical protein
MGCEWMGVSRKLEKVKELVEIGRLMIEPGTPTWRGGKNHRTSTIHLVVASNEADISMAEIATDLYTDSDHRTICWGINEGYNIRDRGELRKATTTRWKIRQPIKTDDIDEEEWRKDWINRTCPNGGLNRAPPLGQIPLFETFLGDIFGRKKWSPKPKGCGQRAQNVKRDDQLPG